MALVKVEEAAREAFGTTGAAVVRFELVLGHFLYSGR